jgi:hypothetical protein
MRINYGCPEGSQAIGDIDRTQPVWRVFFQGEKSLALEQVDVVVAWFQQVSLTKPQLHPNKRMKPVGGRSGTRNVASRLPATRAIDWAAR